MIKYDPSLMTIELVRIKSLSLALGGSITIIDEEKSDDTKEVTKRVESGIAPTRAFIQKHKKTTKYLIPVWTAIVRYDNKICALERHPLGTFGDVETEGLDGTMRVWEPDSQLNLDRYIHPLVNKPGKEWFFDGRYIYSFTNDNIDSIVRQAPYLSQSGNFRKINVMSIDTQKVMYADELQPVERTCVAYVSSTGEYSITPPIWKNLDSVGGTKITEDESVKMGFNFDSLNEYMAVNLNFALNAGKQIGEMFGYDRIEPLQLPRLMLDLHTINLPNIPKQIKSTYDIGMSFSNTFAWLLGLLREADTLESYIMMRSIMKYLTQKGIYRANTFKEANIFVDSKSLNDVQLKDMDELLESSDYTKLKLINIIQQAKLAGKRSANTNYVSGLVVGD